ncbi:MAG: signal peptidase II [Erysipelotrichia bacterium]|nr:signal peptidase II [Erysipelotrichia bacterium]
MSTILSVILFVLLDQTSKIFLTKINEVGRVDYTVIPNFFHITYTKNYGAAFSILQGKRYWFIVITLIVLILLIGYLCKEKPQKWEKMAIILIISGACGNLIDRIINGYVIDFLDFNLFGYAFPVFNIADCYITIGALMLIVGELWKGEKNGRN